ncbi:hypothetical protein CC86DRAFT_133677 [Ophiobolus disseminans]|uniref:Uncharacterized protein n=1 Tax=Ophiobolus disseminans TaxID=1469910 RepID=A0A6A7ACI3_9PLEO|nr:hypothetical protein CC86DRAFT_133677 [Ophiobolus disseminans]
MGARISDRRRCPTPWTHDFPITSVPDAGVPSSGISNRGSNKLRIQRHAFHHDTMWRSILRLHTAYSESISSNQCIRHR